MKRGTPFSVELDGRTFSVPYQGKRCSLKWARAAQRIQWDDAAELRELRDKYTRDEAPEVHGYERKGSKLVKAKGDPVAPGSAERMLDLCERILSDCDAQSTFDELLEGGETELLITLSLAILEKHSLSEKAALP